MSLKFLKLSHDETVFVYILRGAVAKNTWSLLLAERSTRGRSDVTLTSLDHSDDVTPRRARPSLFTCSRLAFIHLQTSLTQFSLLSSDDRLLFECVIHNNTGPLSFI